MNKPVPAAAYRRNLKARTGTTMARRAAKRDASEPEIRAALEALHFSVFRLDEPVDLLVGFRGRTFLVECKTGTTGYGKALNDNQQAFSDAWRGSPVVTLRTGAEAIAWAQSVCLQLRARSFAEADQPIAPVPLRTAATAQPDPTISTQEGTPV